MHGCRVAVVPLLQDAGRQWQLQGVQAGATPQLAGPPAAACTGLLAGEASEVFPAGAHASWFLHLFLSPPGSALLEVTLRRRRCLCRCWIACPHPAPCIALAGVAQLQAEAQRSQARLAGYAGSSLAGLVASHGGSLSSSVDDGTTHLLVVQPPAWPCTPARVALAEGIAALAAAAEEMHSAADQAGQPAAAGAAPMQAQPAASLDLAGRQPVTAAGEAPESPATESGEVAERSVQRRAALLAAAAKAAAGCVLPPVEPATLLAAVSRQVGGPAAVAALRRRLEAGQLAVVAPRWGRGRQPSCCLLGARKIAAQPAVAILEPCKGFPAEAWLYCSKPSLMRADTLACLAFRAAGLRRRWKRLRSGQACRCRPRTRASTLCCLRAAPLPLQPTGGPGLGSDLLPPAPWQQGQRMQPRLGQMRSRQGSRRHRRTQSWPRRPAVCFPVRRQHRPGRLWQRLLPHHAWHRCRPSWAGLKWARIGRRRLCRLRGMAPGPP